LRINTGPSFVQKNSNNEDECPAAFNPFSQHCANEETKRSGEGISRVTVSKIH
jgi:hypothetical protein